jgi:release factor glutamine methyltransferase
LSKRESALQNPGHLLRSARLPRADAEFLLAVLLGVARHELYMGLTVSGRDRARFLRLAARARAGEPVQYLVRSAPFFDLDVYVDRRVLIPRPETEELVARAIARLKPKVNMKVLDYGTGSGCIAIALARAFPQAGVWAADSSKRALAAADTNLARFGLRRRVRLARVSTLAAPVLAGLRGRLDLLISNPPYVPSGRLSRLPRQVRHEPKKALDGGPKGDSIVAMLLRRGPAMLRPGGFLALELDPTHRRLVRRLVPDADLETDLCGRTRYAFVTRNA